MAYNPRDAAIAPAAPTDRSVDWQALCDMVDGSRDVPVVYAFGGGVETTTATASATGLIHGYRRSFVEYQPYAFLNDQPSP